MKKADRIVIGVISWIPAVVFTMVLFFLTLKCDFTPFLRKILTILTLTVSYFTTFFGWSALMNSGRLSERERERFKDHIL
jgi:5-bromo-4-chloroindolyl phosphate hydrolysis protein